MAENSRPTGPKFRITITRIRRRTWRDRFETLLHWGVLGLLLSSVVTAFFDNNSDAAGVYGVLIMLWIRVRDLERLRR